MRHPHADLIHANKHRFVYDGINLLWADNFHRLAKKGQIAGYIDSSGYRQVRLNGKAVLVHRIIWVMHYDTYPDQIDHINRDRLDNRLCNLRASNNTLNQHNATKRKDNSSGFQGVGYKNNRWVARITAYGKRHHLGSFRSPEEAHKAYLDAKEVLHEN
jgi:hypothetical protein